MFRKILRHIIPKVVKKEIKSLINSLVLYPNACISTAIRFVSWNQVSGDYLEFGCYSGDSFCYAYNMFQSTRQDVAQLLNQEDKHAFASDKPRFFAFDSFEGLP